MRTEDVGQGGFGYDMVALGVGTMAGRRYLARASRRVLVCERRPLVSHVTGVGNAPTLNRKLNNPAPQGPGPPSGPSQADAGMLD